MTDSELENNPFYQYLKDDLNKSLATWIDPEWVVCIPSSNSLSGIRFSPEFAASQALYKHGTSRLQHVSELNGPSIIYEITGDEPRCIIWNIEKDTEVHISKAIILNEYLITVQESVVHILLIDRRLPSMIEEDEALLPNLMSVSVTSNREAEDFLKRFPCHIPILDKLLIDLEEAKKDILLSGDVNEIQCFLHDLILASWEALIKRHVMELQAEPVFQDLLFRALDFYVVGICHEVLWFQVLDRCQMVDQMVKTRICFLRSSNVCPSQLGLPKDYDTPLPAAVVEMASLNARVSAIEKLHCVRDTVELIQAQTKETKANLIQFKDSDAAPHDLQIAEQELVLLMMVVLIQAQCFYLVANIYYMTHYIFSVSNEAHPLWHSLYMLRRSLERLMKLDISRLPPVTHVLRKELSLQDLIQVSSEVELTFDSRKGREGSHSTSDITALDLQLHQLTQKIQMSTQALSETQLTERNSPSRRSDRVSSPILSPQSQSKMQSFVEFLSSIPSTIRASFRRKQTQQKTAIYSSMEG